MNQRIQITFHEPDSTFVAELEREDAPLASDLLWQILETPIVGRGVHAMYAGPALLVDIPGRHGEPRGGQIPVENESDRPEAGDILLVPPTPDDQVQTGEAAAVTVAIFYGEGGRPFTPEGWQPGVLVAKIAENIDALRETCRSARFDGAKEIVLAREVVAEEVDEAVLMADGASLGNPGPAGAGFIIMTPDGRPIAEGSIPLEPATVNEAEYRALIAGLHEALRLGITKIEARMDSQLVCRQLSGRYRVKAHNLKPLYEWACKLAGRFEGFRCLHLPREGNEQADALAGAAAKRAKEQYT